MKSVCLPLLPPRANRPISWIERILFGGSAIAVTMATFHQVGMSWWQEVLNFSETPVALYATMVVVCVLSTWLLTRPGSFAREETLQARRIWRLALAYFAIAMSLHAIQFFIFPTLRAYNPAVGFSPWAWSALIGVLVAVVVSLMHLGVVFLLFIWDVFWDFYKVPSRMTADVQRLSKAITQRLVQFGLSEVENRLTVREEIYQLSSFIRGAWPRLQERQRIVLWSPHMQDAADAEACLQQVGEWAIRPLDTTAVDVTWCVERVAWGVSNNQLYLANAQILERFPALKSAHGQFRKSLLAQFLVLISVGVSFMATFLSQVREIISILMQTMKV